jgi:hypothetical protein
MDCRECIKFEQEIVKARWRAAISSDGTKIERWKQEESDLQAKYCLHVFEVHGAPLEPIN